MLLLIRCGIRRKQRCPRIGFILEYGRKRIKIFALQENNYIFVFRAYSTAALAAFIGYAQLAVRAKLAKRKLGNWAPNVQMANSSLFSGNAARRLQQPPAIEAANAMDTEKTQSGET